MGDSGYVPVSAEVWRETMTRLESDLNAWADRMQARVAELAALVERVEKVARAEGLDWAPLRWPPTDP